MKEHGLRGSNLENSINKTIDLYREKKLALIQKIPTPITPVKFDENKKQINLAYFDKKSTVDYIGLVQEIPICFDAKECKSKVFPLKNLHKHQYEFMKEFEEQGGVSFLLIEFTKENIVAYLPFSDLKKFIDREKDGKQSFNMDELDKKFFIDISNKIIVPFLDKLQLDIDRR